MTDEIKRLLKKAYDEIDESHEKDIVDKTLEEIIKVERKYFYGDNKAGRKKEVKEVVGNYFKREKS